MGKGKGQKERRHFSDALLYSEGTRLKRKRKGGGAGGKSKKKKLNVVNSRLKKGVE